MKNTAYLLAVAVLACGAPVFAQGAFQDVPTDHWAYDAVNQLQKDGIVIGYPDGTYGGKRAMSRYEFATAIARLLPMIVQTEADLSHLVTKVDLANQLKDLAKKADPPDLSKFATKDDVNAIRKLVDEFRDELAALGVDVEALKRDLAALCARVEALEVEQKRVRITGNVNVFAVATDANRGIVVDQDGRQTGSFNNPLPFESPGDANTIGRTIGTVNDFDLNIVGRVSDTVAAIATINYGNYLNYIRWLDDFVDGARPTSKNDFQPYDVVEGVKEPVADSKSFVDGFFPMYLYIDWAMCKGDVQVGRLPLQFTPYTLKKIDVDTYTDNLKTDDGNYPVDGIKVAYDFGGVDLVLFAAKSNENDYLVNGLTGQPNSGLFGADSASGWFRSGAPFNLAEGHAVGGLDLIAQSAGARLTIGTPWNGTLGLTYYQAWSQEDWRDAPDEADYDQARVFGADLNILIGSKWSFIGSWTECDTLASDRAPGVTNITDDNTAWDVKLAGGFGKLGLGAGYKNIGFNFAAAGYWDKIGRWANPTNIKGPYVDLCYPIFGQLTFAANGEFLNFINNSPGQEVTITKAQGGLKWGFSKTNSLDVNYQLVNWDEGVTGVTDAKETYLTVGWAHQMSPNAGFKVAYQFINYSTGNDGGPYGEDGDYKGGLGVVQFGVSF